MESLPAGMVASPLQSRIAYLTKPVASASHKLALMAQRQLGARSRCNIGTMERRASTPVGAALATLVGEHQPAYA